MNINQNEYQNRLAKALAEVPSPTAYIQPHPTLKGEDKVKEPCMKCSGTGTYQGPTPWQREEVRADGTAVYHPYCFQCDGKGYRELLVASIRARESRAVRKHNDTVSQAHEQLPQIIQAQMEEELAQKEREAQAQKALDHHQATIDKLNTEMPEGQRISHIPVEVTSIREYWKEGWNPWDAPQLTRAITFTMKASPGAQPLVWFSAGAGAFRLEEGQEGTLAATVKKHDTYREEVQTTITRATLKPY